MIDEVNKATPYKYGGENVPRIQILTVADLIAGKRPRIPQGSLNISLEQKQVATVEKVGKRKGQAPLFVEPKQESVPSAA